jgi:hypothetical protein
MPHNLKSRIQSRIQFERKISLKKLFAIFSFKITKYKLWKKYGITIFHVIVLNFFLIPSEKSLISSNK